MVDLDGSSEFSKVEFVQKRCGATNGDLTIYPNPISPNQGILNVEFYATKNKTQLLIVDILGRTVKRISFDTESENFNNVQIDVSNLASGTYSLQQLGNKKSSLFIIQ